MAERRMFAKSVVLSDDFLDLPAGARGLYFFLGVQADDDGFLNAPNSIIRMCGACPDDLRLLVGKGFLIPFPSGVLVIRHWFQHNQIRKDRYKPTLHQEEMKELTREPNGAYRLKTPEERSGNQLATQGRLEEVRKEQVSSGEGRQPGREPFTPPTQQQVMDYCQERRNSVNPVRFYDYYCSNGWLVGKGPMQDWRAAVRSWETNGMDRPYQKKETIYGCTGLGAAELEAIQAVLRED